MKRHLQYWRASLIDSGKKTPSDGLLNESITESWDEIKKGRSSAAKKLIPFTPEGATPRPVTVCIIAKWAAAKVSHGERNRNVERSIYPIVMFYAKLNNLGEFFVDKDCGEPFVPREFVSPNDGVSFIDMDSLDRFYQGKVEQISSWSDMIRFAEDLYRSLDVSDDCIIEDIEGKCWILADSKNSAADAVIGLYDNLITTPKTIPTALDELISAPTKQLQPPALNDALLNVRHVGQMGGEYGLSTSQRMSLLTFIQGKGRILAVNGAPGTGKTTLLQSVVATLWTQAALDDGDCPLIVGTSTNNQAVENITDAFSKAGSNKTDPYSLLLGGRWIEGIFAYGMNMPSNSAKSKLIKSGKSAFLQIYSKHPSSKDSADHFASGLESIASIHSATDGFLERFNDWHIKFNSGKSAKTVAEAKKALHSALKFQCSRINEILSAAKDISPINADVSAKEALDEIEIILSSKSKTMQAMNSAKTSSVEGAESFLSIINEAINLIETYKLNQKNKLKQLNDFHKSFLKHQASEPTMVSLLAAAGMHSKRISRNRLFFAESQFEWDDSNQSSDDAIGAWFSLARNNLKKDQNEGCLSELISTKLSIVALIEDTISTGNWAISAGNIEKINALIKKISSLLTKTNHKDLKINFHEQAVIIKNGTNEVEKNDVTVNFIQNALRKWKSLGMPDECSENDIHNILDTKYRHRAFLLASHYWEARFLIETEKVLNRTVIENKDPVNLEYHFRRLAMLCPCFVSSMHSLPTWFTGYKSGVGGAPLIGAIDLLIVDESGQVTPEIAAASFALTKRAILVGDTKQIEPVWSVSDRVDFLNAKKYKLARNDDDYELLMQSGRASASGNIMQVAQIASQYASHPEFSGGVFLTQHRRCLKQIISYCNVLVYKGLLEPMTTETNRPKFGRDEIPVMGYAHVRGFESTSGGSKKNDIEAETISKWVAEKKDMILAKYGAQKLGSHLAIVTPFKAQSLVIEASLREQGLGGEGITVGTVHSLQGAERDIVIFSPVCTTDSLAFWDRSPNLLNVAVSRAKDHFLVFGNMDYFGLSAGSPSNVLMSMLKDQVHGIPIVLPKKIKNTSLLSSLSDHREHLLNSIRSAKRKVVIVSPFIRSAAVSADNICEEISKVTSSGVEVLVVVDRKHNLNKEDPDAFDRIISSIRNSGATVYVINKKTTCIHSKLLWVDDSVFTIGSFNWLSARRDDKFKQIEHSTVIRGSDCIEMIEEAVDSINKGHKESRSA